MGCAEGLVDCADATADVGIPIQPAKHRVAILWMQALEGLCDRQLTVRYVKQNRTFGREGDNRIVVDLSQTDFIDSSGIGVLIGCLTSLRKDGGDIRLAGMQKT